MNAGSLVQAALDSERRRVVELEARVLTTASSMPSSTPPSGTASSAPSHTSGMMLPPASAALLPTPPSPQKLPGQRMRPAQNTRPGPSPSRPAALALPAPVQPGPDRFPLYMFEAPSPPVSTAATPSLLPRSPMRITDPDQRPARHASPTATYSRLSPALRRPPSGSRQPPSPLVAGQTTRELGRELIREHMRTSSDAVLRTKPAAVPGLSPELQSILDAYTQLAGDVEKLTGASPAGESSGLASAQRGGPGEPSKASVSAVVSAAGHGFGLSSVIAPDAKLRNVLARKSPPRRQREGVRRATVDSPPPSSKLPVLQPAERPAFGLASVLQQKGALAASLDATAKAPRMQFSASTALSQRALRTEGGFDEGSWIYIMGNTASSVKAKQLAKPQRPRGVTSAR